MKFRIILGFIDIYIVSSELTPYVCDSQIQIHNAKCVF